MPIHKSQYHLYPTNWKQISKRIRHERAGNRCEWCHSRQGQPQAVTRSIVSLQVAHLDHNPANCKEDNLVCLCQYCHNHYDAPMRLLNRKTRKKATSKAKAQPSLHHSTESLISVSAFIQQQRALFAKRFPQSKKSLTKSK